MDIPHNTVLKEDILLVACVYDVDRTKMRLLCSVMYRSDPENVLSFKVLGLTHPVIG